MIKSVDICYKYNSEEIDNIFVTYRMDGSTIKELREIIEMESKEIDAMTIDGKTFEFEHLSTNKLHGWLASGDGEAIEPKYEIIFTNK